MTSLVVGEILLRFGNTMTAGGKYRVQDWENLQLPIQITYLKKAKLFLNFVSISGICIIFETFWNKYDGHSYSISEITHCEKLRQTTL